MNFKDERTIMSQEYEIRIKSHLSPSWSEWLGDLTINHQENGETLLTGKIVDQAALHGILNRIRDLGLALISVQPVDKDDQMP
jgi:hypothetical protein